MEEGEGAGGFFQTDTLGATHVDLDGMAAADAGGSASGSEEEEDEAGGWLLAGGAGCNIRCNIRFSVGAAWGWAAVMRQAALRRLAPP